MSTENNNDEIELTITDEEIQKAVNELENEGSLENVEDEDLTKGDDEDEDEDDTNAQVEDESDDDDEDDDEAEKADVYKAEGKGKMAHFRKMKKNDDGDDEYADDKKYKKMEKGYEAMSDGEWSKVSGGKEKISKSEDNDELDEEIQKALDVSPVLNKFHEDLLGMQESASNKSKATGTILKGLVERMEKIGNKVDEIATQSQGRKSIGVGAVEKSFDINKGEGAEGNEGQAVLSASANKKQILELMDNTTFSKGEIDDEMAKAMTSYEPIEGNLTQHIATRLSKEHNVTIVN